ncbi:hypothetical protein [Neobacillus drentensis]|uniref:hypothetical protein n=1 Tax=Neobacillus drentensis TaxID=220684 RepID=UPI0028628FF4|nr:hypothetical protein [Neobacillus drentensis]MDR7237312.1 hypothetical protein [Neobacillus drentensis]
MKKLTLDEYLEKCSEFGYEPKLPEYFDLIVERNLYKPSVIAELTKVSKETCRRWFREGKLISETASNTYKVSGKNLKEFLFSIPNVYNAAVYHYKEIKL